ncbi:Putative uncharacterized protein [Moritella viscosa]|uniref:Uncharacterized protein n=1 Tax=Moritella viscosa TaxID=80854 RepID=A0ABY1HBX3_9GAMM|nr:Putative uncharacterized protein [Moritella viscosa]
MAGENSFRGGGVEVQFVTVFMYRYWFHNLSLSSIKLLILSI